jgi:hypothetical protein
MKLPRYDVYAITQFTPKEWVLSSDAEVLEEENVVLKEENTALRQRVAYLESCICETCHDPECKDSALNYYVEEFRRYKKENEELRKTVAYVIEKQFCTIDELGTKLENACEETT